MTEIMLRDTSRAHDLPMSFCATLTSRAPIRAAAPANRANATHLIKVAVEAAWDAWKLDVFGTDYPTPDGTCIRDYIHVGDLARAHLDALRHLRSGGASLTLNCGYGHGFSVLEVIKMVKRVSGVDFEVEYAPRREGDPAQIVAGSERLRAHCVGNRGSTTLELSSLMLLRGSENRSKNDGNERGQHGVVVRFRGA